MHENIIDKGKLEIHILNYFNTEELVAEIYYNRIQWCAIFYKNGKLVVQFYSHPRNEDWEFSYEDAIGTLDEAKHKLLKRINIRDCLFPALPETPEQINELGQEMLEKILTHPQVQAYSNRFGGKDIFEPSGKGARFDKEANFMGFLQTRELQS